MTDGNGHETGTLRAADGCPLFTQVWRPEAEPRGVVVLVHGLGEHSDRYPHLRDALLEAGYILAAYDLRGHGRSGGRAAMSTARRDFRSTWRASLAHTWRPGTRPAALYLRAQPGQPDRSRLPAQRRRRSARGRALRRRAGPSRVAPAWQVALLKGLSRIWPTFSLRVSLDGALLSRDPGRWRGVQRRPAGALEPLGALCRREPGDHPAHPAGRRLVHDAGALFARRGTTRWCRWRARGPFSRRSPRRTRRCWSTRVACTSATTTPSAPRSPRMWWRGWRRGARGRGGGSCAGHLVRRNVHDLWALAALCGLYYGSISHIGEIVRARPRREIAYV